MTRTLAFICAVPFGGLTRLAHAQSEAVVSGTPVIGAGKVLELIVALLVVFAAVAALAWVGKRLQQSRVRGGALNIEAAISVGPKERVVIVQADGQRLLLGVGGGTVRTLQVLTEVAQREAPQVATAAPAAPGRAAAPVFSQLRDAFIGRSGTQ